MTSIELKLENKRLKKQIADRDAAIADRDATIAQLVHDVALLQAGIKQLLAQRSGGHRVPEGQGLLFPEATAAATSDSPDPSSPPNGGDDVAGDDEAGDDAGDEDDIPRPPRGKGKKRTPGKIDTAGLPRQDRLHDVPEDQRVDPVTGKALVQIGEKVFEELDYTRAQLVVIRHRQPIYGLPPEEAEHRKAAPVVADLPPRPLENCAASATLLAWLLVQKYANHLPLYRQEEIFSRDGLRLPRQTLCDWALGATEALRPIADCLMARVRAGPVMQLDDTPVKCQGGRGEKNFQTYLWTFVNPEFGGVAYRFTTGRSSELIAAQLGDFAGWLVGDGYSGNSAASEKVKGDIRIGGCWSHVNRKFKDAVDAPGTAKLFRNDIKRLFGVEREADEAGLDPTARLQLRLRQSLPVVATLRERALRLKGEFSDADNIAKAIKYLHNQRRELRLFLEDGRIPIHNNACERSIRPIAVGRRNWLFAGSPRGGHAAAVAYTLIESCRIAKVDVVRYLADVLVRVATHPAGRVDELLPVNWAKQFASQATELALA